MGDTPNETVGHFEVDERQTMTMAEPDFSNISEAFIARRKPVVILTLESSSGQNRIYLNEDVALRDDATPADLIELRRRLMMTITRFNKKEAGE